MAIDFKKLDSDELEMFLSVGVCEDIGKQIRKELERRERLAGYTLQEEFKSERLPDYNSDYLYRAKQLSLEFDVFSLPFTWRCACFDSHNNSKGDFYVGMFGKDKSNLDQKWMHNLGYLSLLFQDESLWRNYEGTYNVINYMVNGIYRELMRNDGNVENVSDLFRDLPEKEEIVRDKFRDVVDYLWTIRSEVVDSRSSVDNHGLTLNRAKTKKKLSLSQKALIEAVAYGCSLEELEDGNYEGAKRLIYVPCSKIKR